MSGNDDLEERKQGVWSMDEVRSSSSDTSEPSDTATTSEAQDISDKGESDRSDISSTEDTSVTTDTATGDSVRAMSKTRRGKTSLSAISITSTSTSMRRSTEKW